MVGKSSVLQMAPSGQSSILALLLQSRAERLRLEKVLKGEQAKKPRGKNEVERLRVEQEVVDGEDEVVILGEKRKRVVEDQGSSDRVKMVRKEDVQTTEGLLKGLVFNYIQEEAPSLMEEFEQSFTFTRSSLRLQEVLTLVKVVKGEVTKALSEGLEVLEGALVLGFLRREAPGLVGEFRERVGAGDTQLELEQVVRGYRGDDEEATAVKTTRKAKPQAKGLKTCKIGVQRKRFTEQEDAMIRAAIEEAGEGEVHCKAISDILDRQPQSVRNRVWILTSDRGSKVFKTFTLEEDLILLEELVIPRLKTDKLSKLKMRPADYAELNERFGKSHRGVLQRWVGSLQPWLLQHYAGTLNLRVEVILAGYIQDTFADFSDLDWARVAENKEFVGHTETSLSYLYNILKQGTKVKLKLGHGELTVGQVAGYSRQVHRSKRGVRKEERQQQVIDFFQRKVEEQGIADFI